jgi:tetratricopeptide (TPR) repeat protein
MAVLEQEIFNNVISIGKKAIESLKLGDIDAFFALSEEAWNQFPKPRNNWNQEYNFTKMVFNHSMKLERLLKARVWLDRMIENNNNLHHSDEECLFYEGKYCFEIREYKTALKKWKTVVKEAGFRYFEDLDPKYLDFYKNPEKYFSK